MRSILVDNLKIEKTTGIIDTSHYKRKLSKFSSQNINIEFFIHSCLE